MGKANAAAKTGSKSAAGAAPSIGDEVQSAIALRNMQCSQANLVGMARYGIPSNNALGVAMRDIKALGKQLGCDHRLAVALWDIGVYEARMLASLLAIRHNSRRRRWIAGVRSLKVGPFATR